LEIRVKPIPTLSLPLKGRGLDALVPSAHVEGFGNEMVAEEM
jgi:hypothetical protein